MCGTLKIGLEVLPERLISEQSAEGEDTAADSVPGELAGVPESSLHMSLDRPFWSIKRVIDVTIALSVAVVMSPIILIVFALVFLDVGTPAIFWQQRVGRNGTALHLYKFRTLKTLFDRQTKEKREAQNPSAVGRFLRATRLDELPQLWNVLSGVMSLVGPRPLLPVDQPSDSTLPSHGQARRDRLGANLRRHADFAGGKERARRMVHPARFAPARSSRSCSAPYGCCSTAIAATRRRSRWRSSKNRKVSWPSRPQRQPRTKKRAGRSC